MAIHNISSALTSPVSPLNTKNNMKPAETQQSFADFLKKSIDQVNSSQIQSDRLTEKLARGEDVDLHQVMIASQKSSIMLQTTMEVRNKVVEAYQEIMRMPM
ncbi:flagellar hook-basal body complex protein FliE [Bacillus seohaeanensis]|jgi:flagellar hook-basal body complex protein FliE|uniref:Flagellar hook-basal body complex protein FliE n=1 Tax=Bacillus seohaeanensis TaxID=284580 RepID=A0ABW5RVU6_9BACI